MSPTAAFDRLLQGSRLIRESFPLILRAASGSSLLLLSGEEGTERHLLARLVHLLSPCSRQPFLGYDRSEARADFVRMLAGGPRQAGLIERAQGGTLFLDGIEELELREQVFLKTLIDRRSAPGDSAPCRFILGADRSLRRRAEEGEFYPGLYYSISGLELPLSPLRQRKEDIIPLARFILSGARSGRRTVLSLEAVPRLLDYDWPGNYRELETVLRRAAERGRGNRIRAEDLPERIRFARYWSPSPATPAN